jgi:soluble lytic murein transglycosylase-like protein
MNARLLCQPRLTSVFGLWRAFALGLLLLFLQQAAHADIWGYVDDKGVAHYAAERLDERYEIFFRGGESFDTALAATSASDPLDPALTPVMLPAVASKVLAFFDVSPSYKVVKHHLREASKALNIDYALLQALIATESGFDALAVSPKGAIGLMQVMPATAERYGVTGDKKTSVEKKLSDPGINIKTGTRYLSYLIHLFPDQLELALAAYNAGEGAVQRAGNKIPNYKETQNYVKTVMQLYTLLKPPAMTADPRKTPTRVRMQMPGGALSRGNMISSASSTNPAFPESPAQTRD